MQPQDHGEPTYIPAAYSLGSVYKGVAAEGFGREQEQVAYRYSRRDGQGDSHVPLIFYVGPVGAPPLVGTANHTGEPLDFGIPGVDAVYHDGIWSSGPGDVEAHIGPWLVHWIQNGVHSITARWSGGVYAVRGSYLEDVSVDDLKKMIASLF